MPYLNPQFLRSYRGTVRAVKCLERGTLRQLVHLLVYQISRCLRGIFLLLPRKKYSLQVGSYHLLVFGIWSYSCHHIHYHLFYYLADKSFSVDDLYNTSKTACKQKCVTQALCACRETVVFCLMRKSELKYC